MDVSNILADNAQKLKSIQIETDTPLDIDTGFLTVTDPNPVDIESYESSLESYLLSLARTGTQALLNALFSLPTTSSPDGPLAQLPAPSTQLPRSKPLPKPKPLTKWEQFAKAKGIQGKSKEKRVKKVWDEEKQDWVNRWGRDGKNKQIEEQWITEVPMNADIDHDPRKAARHERKARVTKNQKQHEANVARANKSGGPTPSNPEREARKTDLERTLATTRTSTASMGKFDRKLEGEKKLKGVKRKFDPTEGSVSTEAKTALGLLSKMNSDARKTRLTEAQRPSKKSRTAHGDGGDPEDKILNVRKAVRFASKGRGGVALGREREKNTRGAGRGKGKRR
ncbi:RRS1-domain-containing protein [Lentinula aciculospora]|uniref:Ribosome biogenesis regulatory protein n=1 Tax=Lentinula aciculospora TaxID=153920 RepID=A0A9W9AGQ7_9AGAR|nr:RRS1-domain-containing protein [Lentinula aciculospora]